MGAEAIINTKRGFRDIATDFPPWADIGANLVILNQGEAITGDHALALWKEKRKRPRLELPGWRVVSRPVVWIYNRLLGRIGAHLGRNVAEHLEQIAASR